MKKVRSALEAVPGVESVAIDFEAKTATVAHGGNVSSAALNEAVIGAGFGSSKQ